MLVSAMCGASCGVGPDMPGLQKFPETDMCEGCGSSADALQQKLSLLVAGIVVKAGLKAHSFLGALQNEFPPCRCKALLCVTRWHVAISWWEIHSTDNWHEPSAKLQQRSRCCAKAWGTSIYLLQPSAGMTRTSQGSVMLKICPFQWNSPRSLASPSNLSPLLCGEMISHS